MMTPIWRHTHTHMYIIPIFICTYKYKIHRSTVPCICTNEWMDICLKVSEACVYHKKASGDQKKREKNVGITILNHPCGNGFYQLSMVIWGMVYDCYSRVTPKIINHLNFYHQTNLVGGFNPSEKYESFGMMIPNVWENKNCSKPPTSHHFQ